MASNKNDKEGYSIGLIWVSPQHNAITRGEKTAHIQPKVMAVLDYLVTHRERVIDNDELLDKVWSGRVVTHSSVQKSINTLRGALSELDDSQDYVVHFSKRGYQIVVPVEISPPNFLVRCLHFRWPIILSIAASIIVAVIIVFWQKSTVRIMDSVDSPSVHYTKIHHAVEDKSFEHTAVHHPETSRIAFVRDKLVAGELRSELIVSDGDGQEWSVSQSHGLYMDIAWSQSGRNLVAVDRHHNGKPAEHATFFDTQHQHHTFHIFTLDFKAERVLEKNRLSYWLGEVKSVTWYNENTLEFVANQAPQYELRRYHYVIPTQKLTQLNPIAANSSPLVSKVYKGYTAVLREEHGKTLVSFLNSSKAYEDWPVSEVSNVAWQRNGNGLVMINSGEGSISLLQLNGDIVDVVLPEDLPGRILAVGFGQQDQLLTTVQKYTREQLIWRRPGKDDLVLDTEWGQIKSVTVMSETKALYALEKDKSLSIMQIEEDKRRELVNIPVAQRVASLAWVNHGKQVVFTLTGGDVMMFDLETEKMKRLISSKVLIEVLDYEQSLDSLWGISSSGSVRNLWRIDVAQGTFEQMVFGGIADVLGTSDGFYFQYLSQQGLWFLDKESGGVSKVANSLPVNVNMLASSEQSLLFVTGGRCMESDLFSLDLSHDNIKIKATYGHDNVETLALDILGGVFGRPCKRGDQDVIGLGI